MNPWAIELVARTLEHGASGTAFSWLTYKILKRHDVAQWMEIRAIQQHIGMKPKTVPPFSLELPADILPSTEAPTPNVVVRVIQDADGGAVKQAGQKIEPLPPEEKTKT